MKNLFGSVCILVDSTNEQIAKIIMRRIIFMKIIDGLKNGNVVVRNSILIVLSITANIWNLMTLIMLFPEDLSEGVGFGLIFLTMLWFVTLIIPVLGIWTSIIFFKWEKKFLARIPSGITFLVCIVGLVPPFALGMIILYFKECM